MIIEDFLKLNDAGFGFIIKWDTKDQDSNDLYYIYFDVYGITSIDDGYSIDETEKYLTGSIKWDSCSNFNFFPSSNINPGYHHFCGVDELKMHCDLIKYLYNKAFEIMYTQEKEDWEC